MPWSPSGIGSHLRNWFRDYDKIQALAIVLLYIQIGFALVGSLGASYNGVLLIDLVVALFALVAIESSSQALGRTYAALLVCAILLDIIWFLLFAHAIWIMSSEEYGALFVFSVKLTLWMQIIGFSVRASSSVLWIQMYRLGVSLVDSSAYRETDFDVKNNFISPPIVETARSNSTANDNVGGSIYDPPHYSSLFEDAEDQLIIRERNQITFQLDLLSKYCEFRCQVGLSLPGCSSCMIFEMVSSIAYLGNGYIKLNFQWHCFLGYIQFFLFALCMRYSKTNSLSMRCLDFRECHLSRKRIRLCTKSRKQFVELFFSQTTF